MATARAVPRRPHAPASPPTPDGPRAQPRAPRKSQAIQPQERHLAEAAGDVFDAKCLALAERHHLAHTARWSSLHDLAEGWRPVETFTCPSASRDGVTHTLTYLPGRQALKCPCEAGSFGNPCGHRGAALMLARTLDDLMRDARALARGQAAEVARAATAATTDLRERMHAEDVARAQGQQSRTGEGTTHAGEGWW